MDDRRNNGRLARIYLGGLLAAMAIGQVVSFPTFLDAIDSYGLGGRGVAAVVAVVIVVLEVGAAVGLLAPGRLRMPLSVGAVLGVAAAGLWTVLAVQGLARGLDIENCGCFGAYLSQPLRWWVLPQDALLLALAVYVLHGARGASAVPAVATDRPAAATRT